MEGRQGLEMTTRQDCPIGNILSGILSMSWTVLMKKKSLTKKSLLIVIARNLIQTKDQFWLLCLF